MSPRKPNMLEAFQASQRAEAASPEAAEAAGTDAAGAGGPLATPEDSEPAPARPRHAAESLMGARRPSALPRQLGLVLGLLLAMAAVFAAGRVLSNMARAAGPEEPVDEPEVEVPAAPAQDGTTAPPQVEDTPQELTADDEAFLSRDNRFSVRAIQFDADERGQGLAYASYRYLREQGFPAVTPLTQGEVLVICVGAEPEQNATLRDLRRRLHELDGPPPQSQPGAFDSAYIVNISDQISDEWRR